MTKDKYPIEYWTVDTVKAQRPPVLVRWRGKEYTGYIVGTCQEDPDYAEVSIQLNLPSNPEACLEGRWLWTTITDYANTGVPLRGSLED